MLYIILGIIIAISLVLLVITIYYNKFNFAIIKIAEAENNIDILLAYRYNISKMDEEAPQ